MLTFSFHQTHLCFVGASLPAKARSSVFQIGVSAGVFYSILEAVHAKISLIQRQKNTANR